MWHVLKSGKMRECSGCPYGIGHYKKREEALRVLWTYCALGKIHIKVATAETFPRSEQGQWTMRTSIDRSIRGSNLPELTPTSPMDDLYLLAFVHWYIGLRSRLEVEVFNHVKALDLGTIVYGDRQVLGGEELDVYLPDLGRAIEVNGCYWHSSASHADRANAGEREFSKLLRCQQQGIQLAIVWEDDWVQRPIETKAALNRFAKAGVLLPMLQQITPPSRSDAR
jgi:G:T-mismatch repair DNA endonuclease (very short patch repair protein)